MVRRRALFAGAAVAVAEPRAARSRAMVWLMQPVRLVMPGSTHRRSIDRAVRLPMRQQHFGLSLIIGNPLGAASLMGSAQMTSLRHPGFPDFGTCRELGMDPGGSARFGQSAPVGVSKVVIARLTGPAGRGVVAARFVRTGNRIIPARRANTATPARRALGTREPRRVAI